MFRALLCVAVGLSVFCSSSITTSANESACYLSKEQIEICFTMQERYGVSAALLASIIQAESSGNPKAQNGNCKGLMQVSQFWALADDDLFDEFNNVEKGTEVLCYYGERCQWDLYEVLAKYHGEKNYSVDNPSSYVIKVSTTAQEIEREWYGGN